MTRITVLATAAMMALPFHVLAAGGGDETAPPKPAVACEGAKVYDKKTKKCVDPQESRLDDDQRYQTVRQLAYAGRYLDAQHVLDTMPETDARRLTYMGFTHRKLGDVNLAMMFYQQAITENPGNILARSYMGQGLVEQGNVSGAIAQLREIRAAGGNGTWAETSLRKAIATGRTYSY